ncbi:MAG: hypothetical protein GY795_20955 [Desulfobacterales bacterium]|nr:hypothetical protein [Desulfobacterales bacterium]
MTANFLIYLIFLFYIGICAVVLWRRFFNQEISFLIYLFLLLPSFMLIYTGIQAGKTQLSKYKLKIHGYQVNLEKRNNFTIGSGINDDIQIHYTHSGRELIESRLAKISFFSQTGIKVKQNYKNTENIIVVNGRPIRSLELTPGKAHRISFKKYRYSKKYALEVEVKDHKPVFRFRGKEYKEGFYHSILFGLASLPIEDGRFRHLTWNNRLDIKEFRSAFKQSAIYWDGVKNKFGIFRTAGKVWMVANDAQIRLDGKEFPMERKITPDDESPNRYQGKCVIKIYSRHIGRGRASVSFQVYPPYNSRVARLELLEKSRKSFILPGKVKNLCLTGSESPFQNTYDIFDYQFPKRGFIIKKEGGRFVFRGELLKDNKFYSCGKVVFTLNQLQKKELVSGALFCILFLLTALFIPPNLFRKEPLIAVIISASVFLLAFRQLLAFRAWQGVPFNQNAFTDSAISPFLFILTIIIVSDFYPIWNEAYGLYYKIHNFFFPDNKKFPSNNAPAKSEYSRRMLLGAVIYGLSLYYLFKGHVQADFIIVAILLVFSMGLKFVDITESYIVKSMFDKPKNLAYGILMVSIVIIFFAILSARMLGGREVIPFIPGRPRPDILLQVMFLILTAFLADYWIKTSYDYRLNIWQILLSFALPLGACFAQSFIAEDKGFIILVWPALVFIVLVSTWKLDPRIWVSAALIAAMLILGIIVSLNPKYSPVGSDDFNRILFITNPERLKSEYFFDYLAHLPMLWSSTQGIFGAGFFKGLIDPSLSTTCVNDHVACVFIQGELGAFCSLLVMVVYLILSGSGILFISKAEEGTYSAGSSFKLWVIFGISFMVFWAAAYMFVANMGWIPLTGKNLPLLGLDSKNDVIRYGLLIGFMLRYMRVLSAEMEK